MEQRAWYLLLAGLLLGSCSVAESFVVAVPDTSYPSPAPVHPSNSSQFRKPGDLPVLQPSESDPTVGTFTLKNDQGNICLKVTMGVEYIVMLNKKPFYFNLDPNSVTTSGFCTPLKAVLNLGMADNAVSLVLTFQKEGSWSHLSDLTAHITPKPCNGCDRKGYPGVLANENLFSTPSGWSFKCNSQSYFVLAEQLSLKLEALQVQVFNISNDGTFGQVRECWADFNKRVIPLIVGAVVVGLLLIAGVSFLVIRDRRREGYQRLAS